MFRRRRTRRKAEAEVALAADVAAQARLREALILQHEHIARCLREELERFLADRTGLDLAGGQWEFDGAAGVLRRVE